MEKEKILELSDKYLKETESKDEFLERVEFFIKFQLGFRDILYLKYIINRQEKELKKLMDERNEIDIDRLIEK